MLDARQLLVVRDGYGISVEAQQHSLALSRVAQAQAMGKRTWCLEERVELLEK